MGRTMALKILARGAKKKEVVPGDIVIADVDAVFMHTPDYKFQHFEQIGGVKSVFDGEKVVICPDHHHFLPASQRDANVVKYIYEQAKRYGIKYVYGAGTGIGHYLMVEQGHVWPGAIAVGSDSHTTAYGCIGCFSSPMNFEISEVMLSGKAWFKTPPTIFVKLEGTTKRGVAPRDVAQYVLGTLGADGALWSAVEYGGSYIRSLSIWDRMKFSLLTIEAGGTCGLVEPDETTLRFMEGRSKRPFEPVYNDPDPEYSKVIEIDVSSLEPQVAVPPQPSFTKPLADVIGKPIQQAYIGGCTGGSIEDMRMAAELLKGRKVKEGVRLIIVPGTREISRQSMKEGLMDIFDDAGAVVTPAYCGPCQMLCVGNLADGETEIGTHPRNLPGRAGKGTSIYLASPYTVAASAVEGKITDPRAFIS
jgi:3-isopropylmalate/(R)-2-methylmalate dehydratase large subunit